MRGVCLHRMDSHERHMKRKKEKVWKMIDNGERVVSEDILFDALRYYDSMITEEQ